MKRTKIVWITAWASKLFINQFEALKKENPNLDLVMVVKEEWRKKVKKNKYFKIAFLPRYTKIFKILFPHYFIKKIISRQASTDIPNLVYFKGLHSYLKSENPDLVISNLYYMPHTWQAARYCTKTKTPFVVQTEIKSFPKNLIGNFFVKSSIFLTKRIFNNSKIILPWTSGAFSFAQKNFGLNNKKKIEILPAGIDTSLFKKIKCKKKKSVLHLLVVARFVPYKRYGDILQAVKLLKEKTNIKFRLSILGWGPSEDKVKKMVREYRIEDKIIFLDKVPYHKINKVYSAHDVLILASYNEAIGMVVPEAMSCGLPVIVSDTSGANTYFENGKSGYLFKTFNYEDLAKKIIEINKNKRTEKMGRIAEEHIKKNFDLKIIGKKMDSIIKKAIK